MIKNIGILSSSLIVGAALNILAVPLLTRFYEPKDFAVYGMLVAVISILSVISNGRLDQALLTESDEKLEESVATGIVVALLFSLGVIVFSALFFPDLAIFLAFACLSNSLFQLTYSHFLVKNRAELCAGMNISRVAILIFFQISVPFFIQTPSLLYGLIAQNSIIIFLIVAYFSRILNKANFQVIRNNIDFIIFNSPHALINSFSHNVPYFLISSCLGSTVTGHYAIIDRLMKSPVVFFSQTIRQLFIKQFSKEGSLIIQKRKARIAALVMTLIGAPFFLGIPFIPDGWIVAMLGSDWSGMGQTALYLGLGYMFIFSNPPTSAFLIAKRKSKYLLNFQIIELIVKIVAFMLIFYVFRDVRALIGIALSLAIYNALIFAFVGRFGDGI